VQTAYPQIEFGKPVIAGTRVPDVLLLSHLAGGVAVAELWPEYELTPLAFQKPLLGPRFGCQWIARNVTSALP
jgi:hypothetical protein